jgi:hypothetical protein
MKNKIEREKINFSKNLKLKYLLSHSKTDKVLSKKRKSDYQLTNSNFKYCKDNSQSIPNNFESIYDKLNLKRLSREFYMTDAVDLAKKLIGKILVRKIDDSYLRCKIVETEAYMGPLDKASHCYNNKKTERTKHFWAIGGKLMSMRYTNVNV